MKIRCLLFFMILWLAVVFQMVAQEAFFKGIVIDASSRQPVAFATIRVQGKAIGVISNEDGSFQIPISFKATGDVLEISSMGYQKKTIALQAFELYRTNVVQLSPALFELEEATVSAKLKKLSTEQIVRYAINNIYTNYPDDPHAYLGYYRDYQLRENQYVNLNEALVSVWDQGYRSIDTVMTKYVLHQYKENRDFEIDSLARSRYDYQNFNKFVPGALLQSRGGNELEILRIHDPVRNNRIKTFSYVYNLREDFMKNHEFSTMGTTYYDNKKVFKIKMYAEFSPYVVNGILYIDTETFAIRKFFYEVNEMEVRARSAEAKNSYDKSRSYEVLEYKGVLFRLLVEYRENGDKMMLNYISFKNKFQLARPPLFRINKLELIPQTQSIIFHLNKPLDSVLNLRKSNIKIEYEGITLALEELTPLNSKGFAFEVNVDPRKGKNRLLVGKLFSRSLDKEKNSLSVKVKRIKDLEGNVLDKAHLEQLYQFREFFVLSPIDNKMFKGRNEYFMQKNVPLFSESQPIFELPSGKTYWMNTPLQRATDQPKL